MCQIQMLHQTSTFDAEQDMQSEEVPATHNLQSELQASQLQSTVEE